MTGQTHDTSQMHETDEMRETDQMHLMHYIYEKGTTVKSTERCAQKPSRKTGLLATPGVLLGRAGSGAPAYRRGLVAVCGALALLTVGLTATPALAAAPETPEALLPVAVKAQTATLHGILDPLKEGGPFELGTYEFVYRQSKTECKGAGEVKTPEGLSLGAGKEEVAQGVVGLTANTQYTVCLIAHNEAKTEAAVSTPVTFETALAPDAPEAAKATGVTTAAATLNGVLNPAGARAKEPGSDTFFYRQSATECRGENEKAVGASTAPGLLEKEPAQASVTELLPNAAYTFCLLVRNEAGEEVLGPPETFTTLPVLPTLSAEASAHEAATSADLTAQIDPNGAETTYRFEYGPSIAYGTSVPVPAAGIGSGRFAVSVSQHIEGLTENTTYHWRVVASNAAGASTSVDHVFVYSTASTELPDRRAYEMVTPPFKNGTLIEGYAFFGYPAQVAEDGSRVIAMSIQCFASPESCTALRGKVGEPYEFTRTPAGWVTTSLAPPQAFGENSEWLVDANTGTALFSMPTGPAEEDEWYARSPGGSFLPFGPVTPPGSAGTTTYSALYQLATADLSHVVWEIGGPPFWPFDKTHQEASVYEYASTGNKAPFLVGVTGGRGSDELISDCMTRLGGGRTGNVSSALSTDGRTVYFTAVGHENYPGCVSVSAPPASELYARVDGEESSAHTVAVSQSECGAGVASDEEECRTATPHSAEFMDASEDGSKVVFLDRQKLTDEAVQYDGESRGHENLYEYDLDGPAGHSLIDVSAGSPAPEVQGVSAFSSDGSHVYFVARGVLTANERPGCKAEFEADKVAEEGSCQAKSGADNLYVYERDASHPEGHLAFIATLSGEDVEDWLAGGYKANVTPDGRFLVFESVGDLTPDDTRTDGSKQIFRYDAETGQLVRISIGEDGFDDNGNASTGDATIAPELFGAQTAGPPRKDPTMSNDGSHIFFRSPVGLTPHALNHVLSDVYPRSGALRYAQNVYEYHEGHVYLISDGHDTNAGETPCQSGSAVCLYGTDTTGHNVFFSSGDQLVPADTDTQLDIYDARVCEPEKGNPCIAPEPSPLPPCLGEACHGIPAATPALLAPGTASFNGEGNKAPEPLPKQVTKKRVVKCKRGFVKSRQGKCVKKKKPGKSRKSAKKASNDRRGR